MGLHTLHRETNFELKPECYWDGLWDTTVMLYMLNRVMGDVHGAIVKCWPEVAGTLGNGRLMASPPSPSLPHSPPELSVADPVVPRDTRGITVHWPSITGRSFNPLEPRGI